MSSRTPIIDSPEIGQRMRQLQSERDAIFRCICGDAIDGHGDVVKVWKQGCPVHPVAEAA